MTSPKTRKRRPSNRGALPPEQAGGGQARMRLIEAAIHSLNARGYHQTSTVIVTKDAGVSRGTLLHYFPSKADLMLAVGNEISRRRREEYNAMLEAQPDDRARFGKLIPTLWDSFKGPLGVARIELMLGGRSDPEVREKLLDLNAAADKRMKDTVWNIVQPMGVTDREATDAMTQLYSASLRGLAVDGRVSRIPQDIESAVILLTRKIHEELDRLIAEGTAGSKG